MLSDHQLLVRHLADYQQLGAGLLPRWPSHSRHICMQETLHWSHILTSRLTSTVKLVGATISCEPCWQGGAVSNAKRHNAHVQSYIMATDQACTTAECHCLGL